MRHSPTQAIRPACKEVNAAIGQLPSGAFNFGLYFQKWFYVAKISQNPDGWKRPTAWSCTILDETKIVDRTDTCDPNPLLDNFETSLALFNDSGQYERDFVKIIHDRPKLLPGKQVLSGKWNRSLVEQDLGKLHERLDRCTSGFSSLGYVPLRLKCPLVAPLVTGLGNEHPTEKGFRFDWTLGIPLIPASSIKGVVRLAAIVHCLNSCSSAKMRRLSRLILARENGRQ